MFSGRFEIVMAHFGPQKNAKCVENGLFWGQKWVKNGSKPPFLKPRPRPFGVHKRVISSHWEPVLWHSCPSEVQEALNLGLVVTGFTCSLNPPCQEPPMCEYFLIFLTSHSS